MEDQRQRLPADSSLPIGTVARLLGVPAPTIRSWERRYGVTTASRSGGGHRRYSPLDLDRLRTMRDEVARGRTARDAASVAVTIANPESADASFVAAFLDATDRMDARAVRDVLDAAVDTVGLHAAVSRVLLPAMRYVGLWWQRGRCDVANEHLATEAARAWIARAVAFAPPPRTDDVILLACGPKDLHTVGLESFGLLLAHEGWSVRMLGAQTPASSLARAVQGTQAWAVVLVSHIPVARRSAVGALQAVAAMGSVRLFYAGNAFVAPPARAGAPGIYLGEDVVAATRVLSGAGARRGIPPSGGQ